jgi:hypothetical protein
MAHKLRSNSSVAAQLKMLGQLACQIDSDPRHPIDVFNDFFNFTIEDREIFLQGYNDRDDLIDTVIR